MKSFDSILHPDPRSANFTRDDITGELRPMQIGDLHRMVEPLTLSESIPRDIRNQFELALDIFLYSWFSYDLVTIAERQGYAALEMALRDRLTSKGRCLTGTESLNSLFEMAVKDGWLARSDFELTNPAGTGSISLLEIMRTSRNELAHGSNQIFARWALEMIRLCGEIIQRLFRSP